MIGYLLDCHEDHHVSAKRHYLGSSHKYEQKRQELKYAAARKVVLVGPMNPESMKLIIALIQEEES